MRDGLMFENKFFVRMALLLILAVGAAVRCYSFSWNQLPHGDTIDDRAAAISFIRDKTLRIGPPSDAPFAYSLKQGMFLDQHPPLWSVAGALLTVASGGVISDPFVAFKILSLASGLALILFLYALSKKLINTKAALAAAAFASASYLLIDYSANGAFYSFQAVLYLCWALVALRQRPGDAKQIFYFAAVSAAGVMTNYQAILLFPATVIFLLAAKVTGWNQRIKMILFFAALFLIFVSPLAIRNMRTFGSPWYSINLLYVYDKAGIRPSAANGVITYYLHANDYILLFKRMFGYWMPYNFYYLNRKLFILAPGLFILFAYAMVDYIFSRGLFWKMFPVLLLVVFHSLISIAWPVMKFRYFVPMVPFVFLIGVEFAYRAIPLRACRYGVLAASFLVLVWFSFAAHRSVPSHTYYYDGAITTDSFGKQGELEWFRSVSSGNGDVGVSSGN